MTFDFFMTLDRSDMRLAKEFNIFDNVSDLESFCVEEEISDASSITPVNKLAMISASSLATD